MKAKRHMPSRSELPGCLRSGKFLGALRRLGFLVNKVGGKGDHVKIIWLATGKSLSFDTDLRRDVLYYVLKEIEEKFSISWDDIKNKF